MAEREDVIIIGAIILVLGLYIEYTQFYADTLCSKNLVPWACEVTPDSPPATFGALVAISGITLIVTDEFYNAKRRNEATQLD
jgi:hypothetical protein